MLRSIHEMRGYGIHATDGDIGKVEDFLFDDQTWTVRYLLAKTGKWFGRKVLISPAHFAAAVSLKERFVVDLTREQVKNSPEIDTDAPVSRQYEQSFHQYYALPPYWIGGGGMMGPAVIPVETTQKIAEPEKECHLRSCREVRGYHVKAKEEDAGHVEDFIVDDESWVLRYLVIDTGHWLPGRKVIISPFWCEAISWLDKNIYTDLSRAEIKDSKPYDPEKPINREYEMHLYNYYGRPVYWNPKP